MGQSAAGQVVEPPSAGGASPESASMPDPLAGGPPPADGQADDLLSQLAGAEIDRMLAEADVEPAAAAVPPPPAEVATPPAPPAEPPAPPPVPSAEVPPPAAAEPAAAASPPVDLDAVLSEAAARPAADTVPLDDLAATDVRPSVIVRLLELVNAPLDGLPDSVREAIGKVAVVTLANAVAVLAYVALFRRHG